MLELPDRKQLQSLSYSWEPRLGEGWFWKKRTWSFVKMRFLSSITCNEQSKWICPKWNDKYVPLQLSYTQKKVKYFTPYESDPIYSFFFFLGKVWLRCNYTMDVINHLFTFKTFCFHTIRLRMDRCTYANMLVRKLQWS